MKKRKGDGFHSGFRYDEKRVGNLDNIGGRLSPFLINNKLRLPKPFFIV